MRTILSLLFVLAMVATPKGSTIAQPSPQPPRIGFMGAGGALEGLSISDSRNSYAALLSGLQELGYVQGRNIIIERRGADGKLDLLPGLAAELVRLKVAVIVAAGPTATEPAVKATRTIPIVMINVGDSVGRGFVESLSLPGGNVTGLSAGKEGVHGKRLELLRDTIPSLTRVAVLHSFESKRQIPAYQRAAKALRVELEFVDVNRAEEFEKAFARIRAMRPDALITQRVFLTIRHGKQIVDFALKDRLPSMFNSRESAHAGGLLSYGANLSGSFRRAAAFVDKILKGANPANLPVEAPSLELVINLNTAKKLGITIAPELLLEADEVIK